jgi:ethanolamine utilization protein EutN
MIVGLVKGTVVATHKDENLRGSKLLVVQQIDSKKNPVGNEEVAVDTFDAGVGEYVLLCKGSPGKALLDNPKMPVDMVVVGIVDSIEA